jgi:ATP-dependent helicase/nuclease subunit A
MSMHQSKGLGFDWVIIPFHEHEKMSGSHQHASVLESSAPDWIMSHPGLSVAAAEPVLAKAERERRQVQIYNSLCLDYVAMTRAKRALTIILNPPNEKPSAVPEKFSDLVRHVGLETQGDAAWYKDFQAAETAAKPAPSPVIVRSPRQSVYKSRPSESFYAGLSGEALFEEDFGAAAKRGVELHDAYQRIEWVDESEDKSLPKAFKEAFVKPSSHATLWRERAYELYVDGRWETGQFDRVVFTGDDQCRKAVIYDFKTNSRRSAESVEAFSARMRERYLPQMMAYRKALAHLTGIPEARIGCRLLLVDVGAVVDCAHSTT